MKWIEKILFVLVWVLIVGKYFHTPNINFVSNIILTIISLSHLFLWYYIFDFSKSDKIQITDLGVPILFGIGMAIYITGIRFKILAYPGAGIIFWFGTLLLIVLTSLLVIRREKFSKLIRIGLSRSIPFIGFCLFLSFLPLRPYLEWKYPPNSDAYINALVNYREEPKNSLLKEAYELEQSKMKEIYGEDFPHNMD